MIAGLVLDLLLVALLVTQAITGWRQGLIVGVASLVGFALGLVGGGLLVVRLLGEVGDGPVRLLGVLAGGLVAGVTLQALGVAGAWALRRRVGSRTVQALDTVVGMVIAVVSAAAVVWVLSWGVRTSPLPVIGATVNASRVVAFLDRVAPDGLQRDADQFFAQVSGEWLPRVFSEGREPIRAVEPPEGGVTTTAGVQAAAAGVVKVRGIAEACGRPQEGSGFVVAEGVVVTNAHVVAGMPEPGVQVGGEGRFLPARIVVFDPERDLAVLAVDDLDALSLTVGEDASAGDLVAVAGFPGDGPYEVVAGRVREQLTAVGADIYGDPGVRREVYSLYSTVRPGNSGGPVLAEDGSVVGVVFARSTTDSATGYALRVGELTDVLPGVTSDSPAVDPGPCAVG